MKSVTSTENRLPVPRGIPRQDWWFISSREAFRLFENDPIIQFWELLRRHSGFHQFASTRRFQEARPTDTVDATGPVWQFRPERPGNKLTPKDKQRIVHHFRHLLEQLPALAPVWVGGDPKNPPEFAVFDCRLPHVKVRDALVEMWKMYGESTGVKGLEADASPFKLPLETFPQFWTPAANGSAVDVRFGSIQTFLAETGSPISPEHLASVIQWLYDRCDDFQEHREWCIENEGLPSSRGANSLNPQILAAGLVAFDLRLKTAHKLPWLKAIEPHAQRAFTPPARLIPGIASPAPKPIHWANCRNRLIELLNGPTRHTGRKIPWGFWGPAKVELEDS